MSTFDSSLHPRAVIDGTFIEKTQSAPELSLRPDGMTGAQLDQRRAALADAGFIPAVSGSAEKSGTSARKVSTWWNSHFVRAEYRPGDAGFPQMPDDYTPRETAGTALSGNRHTHRMSYAGKDVTVRMPSASAIKRFAYNNAGTFDVPVTATFPGGAVSGWLRVTQNGANEWSVQGLNFPAGDSEQVAEAVSAILEARRPSTALRDAGDLRARRAARIEAAGVAIRPSPNDSFITGAGYDQKHGVLAVKIGSRVYGYELAADRVKAFGNSSSIGAAYNRLIKGRNATEVVECQRCHRFNVATASHRCPSKHSAPTIAPLEHTNAARVAAMVATK
jgi:hypothetical protein